MIELELLQSSSAPAGLHIPINESARHKIEAIFDGSDITDISASYGVNSVVSRSKIFKGRPNRLLIDQRAILVKMPDFSCTAGRTEPDDFLYDEAFVIEEEEELSRTAARLVERPMSLNSRGQQFG